MPGLVVGRRVGRTRVGISRRRPVLAERRRTAVHVSWRTDRGQGTLSDAEKSEHRCGVRGVMPVGFGGTRPAAQAEQADGDVTETGHDARTTAGANLGFVLPVGHITHVMGLVLDVPVPTDQGKQPLRRGLLPGEAGDAVGDLFSHFARFDVDGLAVDPEDLGGVREVQIALEFRADLDGAGFDAPVPFVGLPDRRGKKNPRPGLRSLGADRADFPSP